MQLSKITALFTAIAAATVQAAPGSSLEERQVNVAIVRFYAGTGCEEPWLEDTVWFQGDVCGVNEYTRPYGSFRIQQNYFTRPVRIFAEPDCNAQGNYIDVQPGVTDCFAGRANTYSFL